MKHIVPMALLGVCVAGSAAAPTTGKMSVGGDHGDWAFRWAAALGFAGCATPPCSIDTRCGGAKKPSRLPSALFTTMSSFKLLLNATRHCRDVMRVDVGPHYEPLEPRS